jgi:hypothetical protein
VRAFGYFGDPKAAAILRPWAEKDRFARLALCMTGDFQGFRRTLADHDETHFLLEQLAVAWAWAWNTVWTTPRERRKAVDDWYRHREYIRMFEVMLGRIGETQVNDLIGFLGANPQSHVAGTLYGGMARLASPKNAWIFLPLLDADAPEVQEETARAIADLGDGAMTLALCAVLRKKAGHPSAEHRAVLMRVADLFPEDERRRILSEGLRDMSALVAAEALATIRDLRVMGLDADIERQRGSPVWQSDVLILRRADEALAVARRQRGAP